MGTTNETGLHLQQRRYELKPELAEQFLEWFKGIVPVREQYGFRIVSTTYDPASHEFTWVVAHDGDFAAAEQVYSGSPERAAAFAGAPKYTLAQHISMVVDPYAG
jgi:hypothetical protein